MIRRAARWLFRAHSPRPGIVRVYAFGTGVGLDVWWFGCDGRIGPFVCRVTVERA